jgi:hypothetical protein
MSSNNTFLDLDNYHASTKIITATRLAPGRVARVELVGQILFELDTATNLRGQASWSLWSKLKCTIQTVFELVHEQPFSRQHTSEAGALECIPVVPDGEFIQRERLPSRFSVHALH